jgi:hypothetical protein
VNFYPTTNYILDFGLINKRPSPLPKKNQAAGEKVLNPAATIADRKLFPSPPFFPLL